MSPRLPQNGIKHKAMTTEQTIQRIQQLKKEKNAIILAHYYTRPEIQDIADYLGDSLGLSRMAGKTDAEIIVFCGVHFMAETASIISPEKKVLSPAPDAGCSLAESVTGNDLKKWKENNPDGIIVSYVNTTAEVKAYTDYCCTSSNALDVVKSLPKGRKILFVPDKNLGAYIKKTTGIEMELWNGDCCVHEKITPGIASSMLEKYPEADILIHPESNCSSDESILKHDRAFFYSTAGILKHAAQSPKDTFIIATEEETIHKLKSDNPSKKFIPVAPGTICSQMKKITLDNLLYCLENECGEVKVPEEIRKKAILPIERMLKI